MMSKTDEFYPKYTLPIDKYYSKYAFSIDEFCFAHRISRTAFYNLRKAGDGPEIIKLGRRVLITVEAAEKWRSNKTEA